MIEQCVILQQPPIFVHQLAQEYILYRSGELSSIGGEERESETAGECYLVVVKGCPGLTARHAAAPLHSTPLHTVHTRLSATACPGLCSCRPPQLLRAYCELLGVRVRHRWKRDDSSVCLLWLSNSRLGFSNPPRWEGSPTRVSAC